VSKTGAQFNMLLLRKNQPTQAVTIGNRAPSHQSRSLSSPHRFIRALRSKHHRLTKVEPDYHWTVSFLSENFSMRFSSPRCDTPIDGAEIVTFLIGTRFIEFYATTL
jgi:hypothetical protein